MNLDRKVKRRQLKEIKKQVIKQMRQDGKRENVNAVRAMTLSQLEKRLVPASEVEKEKNLDASSQAVVDPKDLEWNENE